MTAVRNSELAQLLRLAEALCRRRGVRLTAQRRRVLAVVWGSARPLGAYDILAAIRQELPRAAPPTVYRALDFLQAQGLVHKLETLHAYVGCRHPEHDHWGQFLICTGCGDVTELEDEAIRRSLRQAAAASGFQPQRRVVELTGTCAHCARAEQGR
jgi:Fur family zinc uptake transcriptional regulator